MSDRIIELDEYRDGQDDEENIVALGLLAAHLLTVPELPEDAPREQLFEFSALAGLASAYGSDLLQYPEPYNRVARAYLERWHPEL